MRYKVDTVKKKIEVLEATGQDIIDLAKEFEDYQFTMGNSFDYYTAYTTSGGNILSTNQE